MSKLYMSGQNNRYSKRSQCAEHWMAYHIRGWNIGVQVLADIQDGECVITVTRTGGSNGKKVRPFTKVFRGPA